MLLRTGQFHNIENFLSTLEPLLHFGTICLDLSREELTLSAPAQAILRCQRTTTLTQLREHLDFPSYSLLIRYLKSLKATGKSFQTELEARSGLYLRVTAAKIDDNTAIFILEDITSDKMRELTLLNRNIELSAYDKGLEEFTIVARTNAQGEITYANKLFCKISKYSEEELLGQDHRILNSGHHPKSFFAGMWNKIHKGESWRGIVKNKAKDGTYYWVDTVIVPIRNEKQELREILSFRFDVTQYKLKEEQLAQLLFSLQSEQKT